MNSLPSTERAWEQPAHIAKTWLRAAAPLALVLLTAAPARAQLSFEYFRGTAYNVPTPLTITQTGYPAIKLTGDYSVRPLTPRAYFAYRFGLWRKNGDGWVLELVHHKMYLENTTPEVQDFEVTHGYNLITLNRGWRRGHMVFLAGGGLVLTFPHSTIRGKVYDHDNGEYHVSGATVQGAVGRRFDIAKHVFATVEGKLTGSWATVPVVDGRATVPNVAFHGLAGVGVQF